MAYGLVGTIGVATQQSVSTANTPAWGTGENRTAGNLLVCFVSVIGSTTLATTPSGWSSAVNAAGTTNSVAIFYKIAAGADAAPTIAAITNAVIAAQLAEFSGNATTSPSDKSGSNKGTASPVTATASAADFAGSQLVLMVGSDKRTANNTTNDTWTSNAGTVTQAGNNNGLSSANHYSFGYILAGAAGAAADTAVLTASVTTNITELNAAVASFKLLPQNLTRTDTDAPTTSESADWLANLRRYAALDDPRKIPGLVAWWKADALALSDGQPVSSWADSIGSVAFIQNTSANQPTYKANILGGKPVVRFNGVSDNMQAAASLSVSQPDTIIVVGKVLSTAGNMGRFFDAASPRQLIDSSASSGFGIYAGTGIQDNIDHRDAFHCHVGIYNGASSAGYLDDALAFSGNAGTNGLGGIISMAFDGNPANAMGGDIAEILVYNRALSTTDRQAVENYLNAKYGLGLLLTTPPGDAAATSESVARTKSTSRTDTDAPVTAEAISRIVTLNRGGSGLAGNLDQPHTAEVATRNVNLFRTASESLTTAESAGRVAALLRSTTDALATSEYVDAFKPGGPLMRIASETLSTAEAALRTGTFVRSASEGGGGVSLTSMVSYWTLDDTGGSFVVDSFGSNILTAFGSPAAVTGKVGIAASFNNANFHIDSNASLQMSGNTPFTIQTWVKFTALPSASAIFALVTKLSDSVGYEYGIDLNNDATVGLQLRFYLLDSTSSTFFIAVTPPSFTIATGTWYHVLGWYDPSNGQCHIRVNDSVTYDSPAGVTSPTVATAQFNLATSQIAAAGYWFLNGTLDEVGIWKRLLTASERTALYNSGAGLAYPFTGGPAGPSTAESATATVTAGPKLAVDALSTAEAATRVLALIRAETDAPVTAEAANRLLVATRSATDAPNIAEVAVRSVAFVRTATESLTTSELATGAAPHNPTTTDVVSTAEAATRLLVATRFVTDAPHTAEAVVSSFLYLKSVTDAPATSEAVARLLALVRAISDAPVTAEVASRAISTLHTATEALSTAESVTRTLTTMGRSTTEAPTVAESLVATKTLFRAVTDGCSMVDSVSATSHGAIDHLTISEGVLRSIIVSRTATESLATAEIVARQQPTSTNESLAISESASFTHNQARHCDDTVQTQESVSGVRGARVTASDSLHTAEQTQVSKTHYFFAVDSLHTSESVVASKTHSVTATDALSTSEAVSLGFTVFRQAQEQLQTYEFVEGIIHVGAFSCYTQEQLGTAESVTAVIHQVLVFRQTQEQLRTYEFARALRNEFTGVALDRLHTSEVADISQVLHRTTSETLTLHDLCTRVIGGPHPPEFLYVLDLDNGAPQTMSGLMGPVTNPQDAYHHV